MDLLAGAEITMRPATVQIQIIGYVRQNEINALIGHSSHKLQTIPVVASATVQNHILHTSIAEIRKMEYHALKDVVIVLLCTKEKLNKVLNTESVILGECFNRDRLAINPRLG